MKSSTLSRSAKVAKASMGKKRGLYLTLQPCAIILLVTSILGFVLYGFSDKLIWMVIGILNLVASTSMYVKAGFMELIEKEYTKKELEPVK